jgi:D-aminopeptidase
MRHRCLVRLLLATPPSGEWKTHALGRGRTLGIAAGVFAPGPLNAITDVSNVLAGHFTLTEGDDIRTGATAIVPHAGNLFQEKVPAAIVVGNGFGKLIGSTQVNELGVLETPIILTNTSNGISPSWGRIRESAQRCKQRPHSS